MHLISSNYLKNISAGEQVNENPSTTITLPVPSPINCAAMGAFFSTMLLASKKAVTGDKLFACVSCTLLCGYLGQFLQQGSEK